MACIMRAEVAVKDHYSIIERHAYNDSLYFITGQEHL